MGNLFRKQRTYKDLYFRILQIGQSRLLTGISYNTLYKQLKDEGFDCENNCVDIAIRHCFVDSFFHITNDKEFTGIENLNEHQDCDFVLRNTQSFMLLEHQRSRNTLWIAWIALGLTMIGIAFTATQTNLTLKQIQSSQKGVQQDIQKPHGDTETKTAPSNQISSEKKEGC